VVARLDEKTLDGLLLAYAVGAIELSHAATSRNDIVNIVTAFRNLQYRSTTVITVRGSDDSSFQHRR